MALNLTVHVHLCWWLAPFAKRLMIEPIQKHELDIRPSVPSKILEETTYPEMQLFLWLACLTLHTLSLSQRRVMCLHGICELWCSMASLWACKIQWIRPCWWTRQCTVLCMRVLALLVLCRCKYLQVSVWTGPCAKIRRCLIIVINHEAARSLWLLGSDTTRVLPTILHCCWGLISFYSSLLLICERRLALHVREHGTCVHRSNRVWILWVDIAISARWDHITFFTAKYFVAWATQATILAIFAAHGGQIRILMVSTLILRRAKRLQPLLVRIRQGPLRAGSWPLGPTSSVVHIDWRVDHLYLLHGALLTHPLLLLTWWQ